MTRIFRQTRLVAVVLLLSLCSAAAQTGAATHTRVAANHQASPRIVVFMTDFGLADDSVGICKAVMLNIAPNLRIVDITHQVPPYSIADGARFLAGTTPYYGPGTVFAVVVDPGVGSSRKAIVVKSKRGQYFVLPDNGLMTLVQDRDGIAEAREITNQSWMIGAKVSSTFHGRDIFSPVAAHLARRDDWTQVGPVVQQLVRLELKAPTLDAKGVTGEIIGIDGPFGNLISNIDGDALVQLGYQFGDEMQLSIAGKTLTLPFAATFSGVPKNHALIYVDSRGRLAIAVNEGNAKREFGVEPPVSIFVPRKR